MKNIEKLQKEITNDMVKYIINFANKYGAWGDWYETESSIQALDEFDESNYDYNDEYVDVWSQLSHEENCDKYEIYNDAMYIATKSFKYKLSLEVDTDDRYLDGSCPCNTWYSNNKKSLVEKVYQDCNWFEYLDEDNRLSEDDLHNMIETIK